MEVPYLHFAVCYYEGIRHCIERGLDVFEPGAGGEHKLVRGFEPALTYSAHCIFHPGFERAVRDYLTQERRAMEEGVSQWRKETGFKDGEPKVE